MTIVVMTPIDKLTSEEGEQASTLDKELQQLRNAESGEIVFLREEHTKWYPIRRLSPENIQVSYID